jgi:hypothetical protein
LSPSFFSHEQEDSRKVIDPEGRVFEPLECGHDWMLLGLGLWENGFSEKLGLSLPGRGRSLKRLHRPNRFKLWLQGFQGGKPGLKVFAGVDAVCPKSGPYEASEGIYPGRAKKKLGSKRGASLT